MEYALNINKFIKVKLTQFGKQIYYDNIVEINNYYRRTVIKPHYPQTDEDGYSKFQFWDFMSMYGEYMDIGCENVIEPIEIIFNINDCSLRGKDNG